MKKEKLTVRDLCFMALYAAIFVVLDYMSNYLGLFKMPQGGSVGFGTIALLLASYHLGWKRGLLVALVSLPLQFLTGQVYFAGILGYTLDYIIAFGIYGIACLFPNYKYFYSGIVITSFIRFCSSTLSGIIIYQLDVWGSIIYNGPYMLVTMIVGMLIVPPLYKSLRKVM